MYILFKIFEDWILINEVKKTKKPLDERLGKDLDELFSDWVGDDANAMMAFRVESVKLDKVQKLISAMPSSPPAKKILEAGVKAEASK